ncbi:hypothetical protein KAFR_0J02310 [Kazachstania africana CBS 2517]|uniref:C2 domain-containing protein n=1 Tax=Kazachstania africana (strain ATCC 22294 / BCRC 22015 / CBS 2517 / CECT 1963 / NBRC 1671 / NRRL Y-8276) TaxID=1071382 RepID=H2B0Z5_KAZAF|nr:hypothetical protein KAFR_0J02310 [Kazachstania africana CBS 2517]CCF60295.1 hypothetical protein KAFR_0J02310 [Kazachstania africana CBS 2517]
MSEEIFTGTQGTLSVYVSKARDLPNLTKIDKQNVLLRLRVSHMSRESETLFRAGQNPVFNYLEKFEMTPDVRPLMQVEAYCDRKKKTPLFIGRCEVDLVNGIRADPKEGYCKWYEMKRNHNEFAGTIFIELTFQPAAPKMYKDKRNRDFERLDASMARRLIPPLPSDNITIASGASPKVDTGNEYTHASEMRQVTPTFGNNISDHRQGAYSNNVSVLSSSIISSSSRLSDRSSGLSPALMSSVGTNNTSLSQETNITTTSDTKFHFANLKKLKERINIFKNPNASNENTAEENTVDIKALQKAIGVTSLSDEEEEEEERHSRRDISSSRPRSPARYAKMQPELPPLPRQSSNRHSKSPKLPPMPTTYHSRQNSISPTRRPPPLQF